MKKVLALLLSLMLLTGAAVAAETEGMTFHVKLSINEGLIDGLLNPMGEELSAEENELLSSIKSLLGGLGFYGVSSNEQMLLALTLNEVPVSSVLTDMRGEEGKILMDLFPNHVLTVPFGAEQIAEENIVMDEEAVQAWLASFQEKLTPILETIVPEVETGEFLIMDSAKFNTRQSIVLTPELMTSVLALIAEEAKTFPMLPEATAQEIAALYENAKTELEQDPTLMSEAFLSLFMNVNEEGVAEENFYFMVEMRFTDTYYAVDFGNFEDGFLYASILEGELIFTSVEEMINAALSGSEYASLTEIMMYPGETENSYIFNLDMYSTQYLGLYAEAEKTEEQLALYTELYVTNPDYPVLALDFAFMPGGEVPEGSTEGKTVVSLADMADPESPNYYSIMNALMTDLQLYGWNNLIATAAQIMPTEVITLINAFSTPAEMETTQVEGVTDVTE